MVRQLPAWHENVGKRQVKAPKVVRDTGILHALLGMTGVREMETHPKVGASWEGFALEAAVARLGARPEECFFWATHGGAELDLLVVRGSRRRGFEFKRTTSPTSTRSLRIAQQDLGIPDLVVVHAASRSFPLGEGLRAVAAARIQEDVKPL